MLFLILETNLAYLMVLKEYMIGCTFKGFQVMGKNTFEYVDTILELLTPIKAITSGKFFGGQGISSHSVQFAMIMDDSLFFVVNDKTRDKYTELGTFCFWYSKKTGRVNVRKYHQVPDEIISNNKNLILWAKESISIATKLKKKK